MVRTHIDLINFMYELLFRCQFYLFRNLHLNRFKYNYLFKFGCGVSFINIVHSKLVGEEENNRINFNVTLND